MNLLRVAYFGPPSVPNGGSAFSPDDFLNFSPYAF